MRMPSIQSSAPYGGRYCSCHASSAAGVVAIVVPTPVASEFSSTVAFTPSAASIPASSRPDRRSSACSGTTLATLSLDYRPCFNAATLKRLPHLSLSFLK